MINRRSFLGTASLAALAATCPTFTAPAAETSKKVPFKLGMAGYSCHRLNLDQTLDLLKRLDVHYLCIKDFHLPLDADDATIAAFRRRLRRRAMVRS